MARHGSCSWNNASDHSNALKGQIRRARQRISNHAIAECQSDNAGSLIASSDQALLYRVMYPMRAEVGKWDNQGCVLADH